jgi:hypothetical protein
MADNSLVKHVAVMWPRVLCDMQDEDDKRLYVRHSQYFKNKTGVYVLYRDEHPYYIGRAKNLGERLFQHSNQTNDKYYQFWNFFSVYITKNERQAAELEGILISAMPALANRASPRIGKIPIPKHLLDELRAKRKEEARAASAAAGS